MIDAEAIRRQIDQMTPDLRETLPKSATEYGNMLMGMYLMGVANMLQNDEMPWAELAADPFTRKMLGGSLGFDAMQVAKGIKPS